MFEIFYVRLVGKIVLTCNCFQYKNIKTSTTKENLLTKTLKEKKKK